MVIALTLAVVLHSSPILRGVQSQDLAALLPQATNDEDKKTIASNNGQYQLTVSPHNLRGHGPTDYILTKNGEKVWSDTKPFFLHEAAVSNIGTVIGTVYNHGIDDFFAEEKEKDTLAVWFLDQAGKPTMVDSWERHFWAMDAPSVPLSGDFLVLDNKDLALLDVVDQGIAERFEQSQILHSYSLSDGKPKQKLDIASMKPKGEWYADECQALPADDLLIQTWGDIGENMIVSLVDTNGKTVWSKTYPKGGKYTESADTYNYRLDRKTLLPSSDPSKFAVRIADDRVEFAVARNGEKWTANEVSRIAFDPVKIRKAVWNKLPTSPKPKLAKSITFQGIKVPKPKIHDVDDFIFAGPHRLAYTESGQNGSNIVLIDDKGNIISRTPIGKLNSLAFNSSIAWMGNGRVLIYNNGQPFVEKPSLAIADLNKRTVTPVKHPPIDLEYVSAMVVFPSGKVAFSTGFGQSLTICDANLSHPKSIDLNVLGRDYLMSVDSLAIDSNGHLLAMSSVGTHVVVFSEQGKRLKVMDLTKRFGDANYVPGMSADVKGGFILYSAAGDDAKKPTMFRFDANGNPIGSFRPHFSTGQAVSTWNPVQVDSSGNMWASDRASLLKMSNAGVVSLVLGAAPQSGQLGDIEDWKIGLDGTHYVLDRRTLCLYAFATDGRLKYQFQPSPEDVNAGTYTNALSVESDGSVRIVGDKKTVTVSVVGKLKSVSKTGEDPFLFRGPSPRADGLMWIDGYQPPLVLADRQHKTVKSITMRPDGGLLGKNSGFAVASDGSACQATTPAGGRGMSMPVFQPMYVSVYGPQGGDVSCFEVPSYWPSPTPEAFDGKRIVFVAQDEVFATDIQGKFLWRIPTPGESRTRWAIVSQDCKYYMLADQHGVRYYALPN